MENLDSVPLALDKRYFLNLGPQIDLEALMRDVTRLETALAAKAAAPKEAA